MRIIVKRSIINILGRLWMPMCKAGQELTVTQYDLDCMRNDDGTIDREAVSDWIDSHAGDFSSIIDFSASLEDGENSIEIPWQSEENEIEWGDCMFPAEDFEEEVA